MFPISPFLAHRPQDLPSAALAEEIGFDPTLYFAENLSDYIHEASITIATEATG